MLSTVLLLVPLAIATLTDVRSHVIHNWTVYPGILIGLALSVVGTLLGKDMIHGTALDVLWYGIPDFWSAVAGFFACGSIMLVCFVFFSGGVGGGDVKLIAMMGTFMGASKGLEAMLWTFVIGGCIGLIGLVWQVGAIRLVKQLFHRIKCMLWARSWVSLTDQERAPLRVHVFLSPAALIAVLIVRFHLIQ